MTAASIRTNNPGAMWGKGNKIATKWGSTGSPTLNDGLGQGNNIAVFPDAVHGACAQFDLWRTGYTNRTLRAAITRWSGGNWSQPYADFLVGHTGISLDTMVTIELLASTQGWKLMKYQAQWEAGGVYPLSDAQWQQAQSLVFNTNIKPVQKTATKAATTSAVVVGTGTTVAAAAKSGAGIGTLLIMLGIGVIVGVVAVLLINKYHKEI